MSATPTTSMAEHPTGAPASRAPARSCPLHQHSDCRGLEVLSRRERQVVALIAEGHSNEEIVQILFLSINSIKSYVRTAYRKMGVTRRTQAVVWAIEHDVSTRA